MITRDIHPPDWSKNKVIYEVNLRQYTPEGTISAFLPHLPRLKRMGVDILWFMPIHPIGEKNRKGSLGSAYSVKDYTAVNPDYGSFEEFKNMIGEIHRQGMYAIIDWVANHAAWDNVWTTNHPEYFSHDSEGNFMCRVIDWNDVIDFDYTKPAMRQALTNAMKFWVREADIDGFRCDVAMMVPVSFWEEARRQLHEIKHVFMLAEAEEPEHHFCSFDASYSWEMLHAFTAAAKGTKNANAIKEQFNNELLLFPQKSYRLRFITNHDENSWNGSEFERLGPAADTLMVLCYTLPGMPLIYTGQEAGLSRKLAFFDKDLVEWGNFRKQSLFAALNALKHKHESLWNGEYGGGIAFALSSDDKVLAFVRYKHDDVVLTVVNLSGGTSNPSIAFPSCFNGVYSHYFKGEKLLLSDEWKLTLSAWEYRIYTLN